MVDNNELRNELLNNAEHWDATYNRLAAKPYLSSDVLNELSVVRDFEKEIVIDELLNGTYKWSIPRKVLIAKSGTNKKRIIYVYGIRDRYVLGVLYRALSAVCKNLISDRCFSYKKQVSTSSAIQYLLKNQGDNVYGVKIDIHAYFNSVSQEKVTSMINELFVDGLKTTMEKLMLTNKVRFENKVKDEFMSLIPGCAMGSFFANYTLRECDQYFEDNNILYARYSDDIIILSDSQEKLHSHLNVISDYLKRYSLEINPKKYVWFSPTDEINFLGLKITKNKDIDIADHSKQKIKKQIHRWCRKGRVLIERDGAKFDKVAANIIRRYNYKNFKCFVLNDSTFGWCHYAFRYITTIKSLIELDIYLKDTLRAMKTGHHNKANARVLNDDELKKLGWVSLIDLYNIYKFDFDYYCEIIELFKMPKSSDFEDIFE